MTESQKNAVGRAIDEEIVSVEDEIVELESLTQPIAPDSSLGRLTRMDAINNQSVREGTLRTMRLRLARLMDARARFTLEDFGVCQRCGKPIQYRRLLLIPESTHCPTCAERP